MNYQEIAGDLAVVEMRISNAYLVGNAVSWALVDAGTPGNEQAIIQAAEARFGAGTKPRAIVLTHGHFDHAGSAPALADYWGVRVYAHRLEFPYLTGRSSYPPLDPTAPGFFSFMSRFMPSHTVDVGDRLIELGPADQAGLSGWRWHHTPGHTPGHVVFFRPGDRSLLAGDALTTMDTENLFGIITKRRKVSRPPVPATTDWDAARRSVQFLATLRPRVLAAGHGRPMQDAAADLQRLAAHFPMPGHGRYAGEPARADESGITYLPPRPFDWTPKIAAAVGAGVFVAGAAALVKRRRA